MYYCLSCEEYFEKPDIDHFVAYCPNCGSDDWTEAQMCRCCHEYFPVEHDLLSFERPKYCPDCVKEAEDELRQIVTENMKPELIEVIRYVYMDFDFVMGGRN